MLTDPRIAYGICFQITEIVMNNQIPRGATFVSESGAGIP